MAGSSWTNQVQNQVIVGGSINGGVFVFDPAVAAGDLIGSISDAAKDPFGDAVLAGITSYLPAQFAIRMFSGNLIFYTWSGAAWTQAQELSLASPAPDGTSETLLFNGLPVTFLQQIYGGITAIEPGSSPPLAAAWHNVTLDAGWTTGVLGRPAPRYRLLSGPGGGLLQMNGAASAVAGAGGKTLNSGTPLPAAWRPAQPCDFYSSDAVGNRMHIGIAATGVITATFPAGAAGTWFAEINGIVPLD